MLDNRFEKYIKTTYNPEFSKFLGAHANSVFIKFVRNGSKFWLLYSHIYFIEFKLLLIVGMSKKQLQSVCHYILY